MEGGVVCVPYLGLGAAVLGRGLSWITGGGVKRGPMGGETPANLLSPPAQSPPSIF